MATSDSIESIIVLDCGSTTTRAVLIDLVDGRYRFIARGETFNTQGNPGEDLLIGVKEAVQRIENITGRTFLDDKNAFIRPDRADGRGVDAVLIVANVAQPLRLILVGLSDQVSLASARRAIRSAYAFVEHVISPESEPGERQNVGANLRVRPIEDKLDLIVLAQPEVIVLTGGIDGGPAAPLEDLVTLVTLGCSLIDSSSKPQIVYAGNAAIREQVAKIVGDMAPLNMVDNLRPNLDTENIESLNIALDDLYKQKMLASVPGFRALTDWSEAKVLTSLQALGYVMKYLAYMWGKGHNVLGVDIGGSMTTAAFVVNDEFNLVNRPDLGVSRNINHVISEAGLGNITRWLPIDMDEETALDRLLNKAVRGNSLPQTLEDLYLEQAVAREALRLTLEDGRKCWRKANTCVTLSRSEESQTPTPPSFGPEFEVIVGSGGALAHVPQHGQAVLILLDAIQPGGITTLWLDATSLAVPVGALATLHPLAATHVMEGDAFLNLGTAICPIGVASRAGEVAMRVTVTYGDKRTLDVEIAYGTLEVIPLPLGEEASLEVRPLRGFDVGAGPGKKRRIKRFVGGMMGLIIDARGRPLVLPTSPEERRAKLRQWFSGIGA